MRNWSSCFLQHAISEVKNMVGIGTEYVIPMFVNDGFKHVADEYRHNWDLLFRPPTLTWKVTPRKKVRTPLPPYRVRW